MCAVTALVARAFTAADGACTQQGPAFQAGAHHGGRSDGGQVRNGWHLCMSPFHNALLTFAACQQ